MLNGHIVINAFLFIITKLSEYSDNSNQKVYLKRFTFI